MSEPNSFDCPSCFAPMVYKGSESLFQNCEACKAPVIVPANLLYNKSDANLASVEFASLKNDIEVDIEQVTNQLTPGDSMPNSSIAEGSGFDAVIEKFDVFQEKIGSGSVAAKKMFDEVTVNTGKEILQANALLNETPFEPNSATLDLIRNELSEGDKVGAFKIFEKHLAVASASPRTQ